MIAPWNDVFLDTVGLIAVWNRSDQWHATADEAYKRLAGQSARLWTTTFVLLECGNFAARRPYRQAVIDLRRQLMTVGCLIEPTVAECEQAWEAYNRGEAAQAGIVDHVSFVVMTNRSLRRVFTNDRHFGAAGFELLF